MKKTSLIFFCLLITLGLSFQFVSPSVVLAATCCCQYDDKGKAKDDPPCQRAGEGFSCSSLGAGWSVGNDEYCPAEEFGTTGSTASTTITGSTQRVCKYNDILPKCTCDGNCDLDQFVQLFINLYAFGLRLLGPLAAFYLIVGGVILMTSSGYQTRVEMGKNIINQAIAGVFIVLVSWVVIDTTIYLLTYDQEGNPHHLVFQKPWAGGFTYNCEGSDVLERGCQNTSVRELETNLSKLGYTIRPDQQYDQETEKKVRQFQSDNNTQLFPNNLATGACSQVLWVHIVNGGKFDTCTWGEGTCLPVTTITAAAPNDYTQYHLDVTGTADAATITRLNDIAAFQPKEFTKCITQP